MTRLRSALKDILFCFLAYMHKFIADADMTIPDTKVARIAREEDVNTDRIRRQQRETGNFVVRNLIGKMRGVSLLNGKYIQKISIWRRLARNVEAQTIEDSAKPGMFMHAREASKMEKYVTPSVVLTEDY